MKWEDVQFESKPMVGRNQTDVKRKDEGQGLAGHLTSLEERNFYIGVERRSSKLKCCRSGTTELGDLYFEL